MNKGKKRIFNKVNKGSLKLYVISHHIDSICVIKSYINFVDCKEAGYVACNE